MVLSFIREGFLGWSWYRLHGYGAFLGRERVLLVSQPLVLDGLLKGCGWTFLFLVEAVGFLGFGGS